MTTDKVPTHVGIIMDGNRRWARSRGLPTLQGHLRGYRNLRTISRYLFKDKGVKYLSVFAFSTENWSRSKKEVGYLMRLLRRAVDEYLEECQAEDVRLVVLGGRHKLEPAILEAIGRAETATQDNKTATLALCLDYGGQQEIVDATKNLLSEKINADELTADAFAAQLYHPEVPSIDLLIRTSGEQRLSGFMLWRAAYAELYFTPKHWPAFSTDDVDAALTEFAQRQRRYGA